MVERTVEGFVKENTPKDVEVLRVSLKSDYRSSEEEIKYQLSQQIGKHLLDSDFLDFQKYHDSSGFGYEFSARLFCLKPKGSNNKYYMMPEEVFRYNNTKWTEQEIKEALKNTFPERFI